MVKILYGSFEVNKPSDYYILLLKVIYVLYTLPFLVGFWVWHFMINSMEHNTLTMRILLHILANIFSPIGWAILFNGFTNGWA